MFLEIGPRNRASNFISRPDPHYSTMLSITTAYEKSHDTPNEHLKRPQKVLGAPGVRLQAPPMHLSEASSKYRTPLRESCKRIEASHGHIMADFESAT